ncbi:MAG TPA: hypothetical protein PLK77_18395 [Pyrinomonadaceae bacterium]|jgi:hypothetical protein|nr:hypothetical protein [Pyrinomonadaceae bacterium]
MGKYRWKEYESEPREQDATKIRATINRRGNIYLNERAIKAMGDPEVVVLMYDAYMQTIGVKASTLDKRNAFRPKKKDAKIGGRVLYAANFCREFSIKPRGTMAFVRAEVDNEGVLILAMRDTMSASKK